MGTSENREENKSQNLCSANRTSWTNVLKGMLLVFRPKFRTFCEKSVKYTEKALMK